MDWQWEGWSGGDADEEDEGHRSMLPTPFSFYVSPSPPSPTTTDENMPHSSARASGHVPPRRLVHSAAQGEASASSSSSPFATQQPPLAPPRTARRAATSPASSAYSGFLPARYSRRASADPPAGPDTETARRRRRSGAVYHATGSGRRATLSPLSSVWTLEPVDEAQRQRQARAASEGGLLAARGDSAHGASGVISHPGAETTGGPSLAPGKVGSLLTSSSTPPSAFASDSPSASPAGSAAWELTAPDPSSAQHGAMHPASASPSARASFQHQQQQQPQRQDHAAYGYVQGTGGGTLFPHASAQGGGARIGRAGSETHLERYSQEAQQASGQGSGQEQFAQQQHQQQQQQHLGSAPGAYDYRSHPSSPNLFSSSLTPSPLIGGSNGNGQRLTLPLDIEHDSSYLLNQYLGANASASGLYRTPSNPASFNGSSYAHSYGATSDFGDEFDFAAFGLEDPQFGQGSTGGRSYEPSEYGGDEQGGLQETFNFGAGGALADLNAQQQQQQQQQQQAVDQQAAYQQSVQQQQQQHDYDQAQTTSGLQQNMPYRDLMGGPGSLLIAGEQAQNQAGRFGVGPNQAGPSQQAFFAQPTEQNDVIYAEPASMSASLTGGFPHNEIGSSTQYTQAPAPSQAQPVAQIAPHLFDGNKPSEFARRMNSEASEMSVSNESEPSSRQNSLATKNSMQFGGSAPGGYPSMSKQMQQEGRRSAGSMSGFPYPQFPGVAQNSKPQSPPQLIIPESPLPTAGTIKNAQAGPSQRPAFNPPPQPSLNTLLPPANPHLPYGAHLPNMSPIGPGGPSINIVPSTPTSALKDNVRGIWERMAMQAKGGQQQQQQGGPGQPQRQPSMLGSQPMHERRASHAGVFDQSAEVDFEALLQQVGAMGSEDLNGAVPTNVPGTAPAANPVFQFAQQTMRPTLRAPGQAHRQRSRSESYMTAIMPEFDSALSQEQLLKLMMGQQADSGYGGDVDMSGSTMGSVTGSPASIDPKVLNPMDTSHSPQTSPYLNSNNVQAGNMYHLQLDQYGQPSVANSAPPWQTSHVVSGPEAFGANFIVANDGRRIPFESMYKAGGLFPNQAESSMRTSIAHSDVSSDAGGAGGGGDMTVYDSMPTSPRSRHRRAVQSEDMGRGGRWASAEGNDNTANFLNAIVHPSDGSLLPPQDNSVGHPRMSAAISHHRRASSPYARDRSSSVVSSASSAGGSGNSPEFGPARPRGLRNVPQYGDLKPPARIPTKAVRAKVTTPATQMASEGRRTHDGQFICPVPGCGSTFTRHFNLKGHLRSHNEERPFKCTFEGCTKSFARQHDCKRHMQLHVGLKPFVCEGCQRTFARLDALSRHHKTEAGLECAINHPLPTNPDGSLLSESKYRAEMARRAKAKQEGITM